MAKVTRGRKLLILAVLTGLLAGPAALSANTRAADISDSVAQSFNAGAEVQTGMIVRLKKGSKDTVVPLEKSDVKNLLGVVVPAGSAPVVLGPDKSVAGQVLVARKGMSKMLVSNQNDAIKSGDLITVSSAAGIGMKSTDGSAIIGKAAQSFDGQSGLVGNLQLAGPNGVRRTVGIARINVDLNAPYDPAYLQKSPYVPQFLSRAAANLANKPVSPGRIYLSLAVLGLTAFISGNLLAGGVRGSLVAIGRNPLSKKSIFRGMVQAATIGALIFVIGLFAVYLLLKL